MRQLGTIIKPAQTHTNLHRNRNEGEKSQKKGTKRNMCAFQDAVFARRTAILDEGSNTA